MRKNRKYVVGKDYDIYLLYGKQRVNDMCNGIQALTLQETKRVQKEMMKDWDEFKIYRLVLVKGGKSAKKK